VVLLQQGKGADLSVFGGGSTQAAFGARGATTLLHKLTVASFVVFILTTLLIGIPQARRGTVMSEVPATSGSPTPAPAAPATPTPAQPQR
jgi:preprotein translocase subunit SecG